MDIKINNLTAADKEIIQQLAQWLTELWPNAWPHLDVALQEVQASLGIDRISRVAVDDRGTVLGWIGGIEQYDGNVWELHPLVVKAGFHRQGIGRSLVNDLEAEVRKRGAITLWVGTDDEENQTTLSNVNLYPNIGEHIAKIRNLRCHPYEFYQKVGFAIVGVMPDANGLGKPDIYMAKCLR